MSWRDPDWLPPAAPHTGPDALPDDGICEYCDGTGIDLALQEARGYTMDCQHCGGTGYNQDPVSEIDPDTMPGGVDDL